MDYLAFLASPGPWISVGALFATCLLALGLARLAPAEPAQDVRGTALNLSYMVIHVGLQLLAAPITSLLVAWLALLWSGSLIALPATGWGLLWAIPAYTLTMDLGEYLFHRAQHRLPLLWAMHSLHHSDKSLNASTTERHFWGDFLIKAVFIYAPIALVFGVNTTIIIVYTIFTLWNFFVHANLRLSLGRLWPCLNTPHYHRLHHSADPRYFNANYAALFPVFDWLFGTAKPGTPGEYPATGLDTGEAPRTLMDAVLWPWRQQRLRPAPGVLEPSAGSTLH